MKILNWQPLHPKLRPEHLGYLPSFVFEDDPRPAKVQFDERYIAGWLPFEGFILNECNVLLFPGDPPLEPLAQAKLRDELILFYRFEWVAIVQPDRSFEVCRMD
jgi:hypothetical protein